MKQLIIFLALLLPLAAQSQVVDSCATSTQEVVDSLKLSQKPMQSVPVKFVIPREFVDVFTREVIVEQMSNEPFSIKKVWVRVRKPLILLTATYLINLAGHKGWIVFSF
jgi:hypothetical protein